MRLMKKLRQCQTKDRMEDVAIRNVMATNCWRWRHIISAIFWSKRAVFVETNVLRNYITKEQRGGKLCITYESKDSKVRLHNGTQLPLCTRPEFSPPGCFSANAFHCKSTDKSVCNVGR